MASTWGASWGTSWLATWDRTVVVPPVVPDQTYSGGWDYLPRKKKRVEPEEAIEIIEASGTPEQQERAVDVRPLLYKLAHAKAQLDAEQKRRARAEAKWAMAVANRILKERDDEEIAAVFLLLH